MDLLDEFATRNPEAVARRGGETFVAADAANALIDQAEARDVGILGIEGFIIGEHTYPALSRIADFSRDFESANPAFVEWSCQAARQLLAGPWSEAPSGREDQIHPQASGRYMLAFVFDE